MKRLSLFSLSFCMVACSFSQSPSFIVSNGISRTFLYGDTIWKDIYKPALLYNHSIGLSLPIDSNFSVRFDIQHHAIGTVLEVELMDEFGDETGEVLKLQNRMHYVSLPVRLEYYPFRTEHLYAAAGGYAGYNYRSESYFDSSEEFLNDYDDFTELIKRWDFGILGGIGGGIKLHSVLSLNFEFTQSVGFTKLSKLDGAATQKSYSTLLNIAFRFQLM